MNSRAFFSIFVSAFAVIFLISFFYAQSVRFETQSRETEMGILQQSLSKDWFLTRNALSNFASDAILSSIEAQYSPSLSQCNSGTILNLDFADDINDAWDSVTFYTNQNFGTNCDVNLSGDMEVLLENSPPDVEKVLSGERAYGLLSCTRSTPNATLTLTRPFVIRKDVRVKLTPLVSCDVNVFDILGDNGSTVIFEKQDVNKSYP